MEIGIIGGGYVGSLLAKNLTEHHVIVATRTKPNTFHMDIYDKEAFYSFCENLDVLIITMTPDRLLPPLPQLSQIIYTSSTSVYQNQEIVDEKSNLNNSILAQVEKQFPSSALIFRLAGIYGPGREIAKRIRPIMAGRGDEPTNSIHVEDVVRAIIFGIENKLSGIYNLCNNDHPTRSELYCRVAKQLNIPPPTFDASLPLHHGGHKTVINDKIILSGYRLFHPKLES